MNSDLLIRLLGWRGALFHGDSTTLDRWRWLEARLTDPPGARLIDIGCGTGAFTIGAATRGYTALGLSWDTRNQTTAQRRARLCAVQNAVFEILDVRKLNSRPDLIGQFDVAVLCEVIEHILDDQKLTSNAAACLKPGGRLLLTTPNYDYHPITPEDRGPFLTEETGWHVRKGYREADLRRLCEKAGLQVDSITYCAGFLSQKITWLFRVGGRCHRLLGWVAILPLRIIPPLLDVPVTKWLAWPQYSICLEARKK